MSDGPQPISQLIKGYEYLRPKKGAGKGGVHGDMLRYFCSKLNPSRQASGYKPLSERGVQKVLGVLNTTRDLFWLKSVCDDAERRGYSWSKRFWYYVKLQTHIEDLPPEVQALSTCVDFVKADCRVSSGIESS